MIILLTGENSFEIDRALQKIVSNFNGQAEKYDGAELVVAQLPDLLMGATLFAAERLVIIKELSENKQVWEALSEWLPRLSDDVQLVLVDTKPDKRTKTYKAIAKEAHIQEYKPWSERDTAVAQKWVMHEAAEQGWTLDPTSARLVVERIGVNQWELWHALQKLAVLEQVTPQVINEVIEAQPSENVFNLFEAALNGQAQRVSAMLRTLELTEDPYMVFGLLSGQVFQLAVLAAAEVPSSDVAKAIGAHPFALSKLAPYAKSHSAHTKKILTIFANADTAMKTSGGEPWLLIERALVQVATLEK